jgi:hypothetical protein
MIYFIGHVYSLSAGVHAMARGQSAQQRPRLNSRPVCVGFVVDKLALGQVFPMHLYFVV